MPVATPIPMPSASPMPLASPTLSRVSFEEFLADPSFEGRHEWVDGEVFAVSPVSDRHQWILGLLYSLMREWPRRKGRIYMAPYLMRLPTRPSGREPDLLFLRRERLGIDRRTYIDGPADLVVEIVSPESRRRDTTEKRAEYEAAGVGEYWLIDPMEQTALFLVLDEGGRNVERAPDPDGFYRSPTLEGMPVPLDWLWNRPDPEPGEIPAMFAAELARLASESR